LNGSSCISQRQGYVALSAMLGRDSSQTTTTGNAIKTDASKKDLCLLAETEQDLCHRNAGNQHPQQFRSIKNVRNMEKHQHDCGR
jgi:hypothetical protein